MISQYANSPKFVSLVNGLTGLFSNSKLISDWFNVVYNIKTAKGFGLDIWGKILNQGRNFTYTNEKTGVKTYYYLKGEMTIDGTIFSSDEIENTYRTVLIMKALSNITNATAKSLNDLLQFYFQDRGKMYVIKYDTMKIRYVFEFYVNKLEKSIFTSNVMPKPTGVGVDFRYIIPGQYFGFHVGSLPDNEQFYAPFDNKPFYR